MAKGIVSSNPQAMVSGGLINDVDVVITHAEWAHYDYGGQTEPRFVAAIVMQVLVDGQPVPEEHCQYYAAGSAADWGPDPADNNFTPLKLNPSKTAFTSGSNWALFAQSLVDAGFPANKLDDSDLRQLLNLKVHVLRKAVKREGLAQTNAKGRENTVLLVTGLIGPGGIRRPAAARPVGAAAPAAPAQVPPQAQAPAAPDANTGTGTGGTGVDVGAIVESILKPLAGKNTALIAIRAKAVTAINAAVAAPAERKAASDAFMALMADDDALAQLGITADRSNPASPAFQWVGLGE